MILEGIVTTINADDSTNISPMGPKIEDTTIKTFVLRPFQTSTTYRNLKRNPEGVLHVTDDVMLIAKSAVGKIDPVPELRPADRVEGRVLADACRWFEFRVTEFLDQQERTTLHCQVVNEGAIRDFFGFNRGKHAVIELAILATRLHILEKDFIQSEVERLFVLVDKTGGVQEHSAFEFLRRHIDAQWK